ncbi:MAG: hypothetical protein EVB11_09515 [Winogradskyella sp.]|nr:MAG: hypothetical protein EVB11_09515 [Winogradskyella sp.]
MSARIITDEKEGISYRECSIESKVNNLSKIHIGVGPVHILESTLESLTSGLKIEKDTTPEFDTEWDNYILKLPKALMKGDKYHFKIKETAKAKRGKKMARCLSFVTDRQLDQLTLSVSFSKTAPNEVYYREYLVSNELRMEETLYPSEITFEAKKTSKYCRPRIRYALEW